MQKKKGRKEGEKTATGERERGGSVSVCCVCACARARWEAGRRKRRNRFSEEGIGSLNKNLQRGGNAEVKEADKKHTDREVAWN